MAVRYGRVPTRVMLCGEPGGWRYTVVDQHGSERHVPLDAPGTRWGGDPEPSWWRRRLDDTAESLRDHIAQAVTDQTFTELGAEARIAWFALEEPTSWEGLVTLEEPDPARFPGKVPPFAVTLEPGRGALLPNSQLLFSTHAADAWTTLQAVSERCGTPDPRASLLCGWAGHRSVRVGRGGLRVSTARAWDGTERIAEVHGFRGTGWGGNPELRLRLDGIDLLDEPAGDVVELLRGLGHDAAAYGGNGFKLSEMGLTLHGETDATRFTAATLGVPEISHDAVLWGR